MEKQQTCKKCGIKHTVDIAYSMRAKTRRQDFSLFNFNPELACVETQFFHCYVHVPVCKLLQNLFEY